MSSTTLSRRRDARRRRDAEAADATPSEGDVTSGGGATPRRPTSLRREAARQGRRGVRG
ncbi:hypothetical protein [Actinocorallia sp. A-T 12471]|uniref:hypothetical protein n=1 Tax=Actinocorallia sp. A-T 12471 TaxID=3089813 RepID=UPI0029CF36DE|nr:hypothetical protein [Actinocorallia sp. A-T 12471]MDX6743385.1 hypothetical protein [Actinocorallia sp. A-T 12471]